MRDVVYIVRNYPDEPLSATSHLRYSLRTLCNLPHGRVWMVGHMPSWVKAVGHIPTSQQSGVRGAKDRNMTNNVIAACRNNDATAQIILTNDDFYWVRPGWVHGYWHSGPLDDLRFGSAAGSPWNSRLRNTRRILAQAGVTDPRMFDNMHHPTVIDRAGFLDAMSHRRDDELVFHQTVYLNLAGVESTRGFQRKIRDGIQTLPSDRTFVSTGPDAWAGRVGDKIRQLFSDPSPYERA